MKYLFFLLMVLLMSCGNNNDGGGGDDEIKPPLDTTLTPPTDTLGVDSVVTLEHVGKRKGVDQTQEKSIVYYQLVKRTFKYKIQ